MKELLQKIEKRMDDFTGGDAVVGIAGCGVVDVAADVTDVFHGCASCFGKLLAEVAVQQTLEGLAVAGFVARHLVHGVMDRVEVVLLGELGQLELAGSRAVLCIV